jgi:hypothetical protein
MKILILITTYNRPDSLMLLLQDLKKDSLSENVHILLYDDCSSIDYEDVLDYLHLNFSYQYFKSSQNHGKKAYWRLINSAFQQVKNETFDYFINLQDDIRLIDDFLLKSIMAYDRIIDRRKIVLNLLNDYSRQGKRIWTNVFPRPARFDGHKYYFTGWVDMCAFICTRKFFDLLNYKIYEPESKYLTNPELSSGVGCQISKRIVQDARALYQVWKSYVIHSIHESVMHPEHRRKTAIISNHEKVVAGMAAIPERIEALKDVVASLLDQVDELHIYLNNWKNTPDFLKHPRITLYHSAQHQGDLGDAGKFYQAEKVKGYHFTVDDDIIYPPDYVKQHILNIETHNRQVISTYHGRRFLTKPVRSYYNSAEQKVSCLKSYSRDYDVDIPGTGVMAYHTDTIQFEIADFELANMADIWVAKKAKKQDVKMIAFAHSSAWIRMSTKASIQNSIYINFVNNDVLHTKIVNAFL